MTSTRSRGAGHLSVGPGRRRGVVGRRSLSCGLCVRSSTRNSREDRMSGSRWAFPAGTMS